MRRIYVDQVSTRRRLSSVRPSDAQKHSSADAGQTNEEDNGDDDANDRTGANSRANRRGCGCRHRRACRGSRLRCLWRAGLGIRLGNWLGGRLRTGSKYDSIRGWTGGGRSIIVDNRWRANVENERWVAASACARVRVAVIVGATAKVELLEFI